MAGRRPVAVIAGVIVAVGALFAIPVTRRLIGALLVAALTLGGCEVLAGSYTKRHCDAFEEAWTNQDVAVGEELLALSTPPEGEEVVPAVHDAAVRAAGAALGVNFAGATGSSDEVDQLLAECAKVTE